MRAPKLNARDRRALLLGAAVLGPALVWTLAVAPYFRALSDARERLTSERSLLRRELELLATAADYPKAFDAGAQRLLKAAPRLMGGETDGAASAAAAGYVRRLATIASASLSRVEPGEARVSADGVTALPVGVSGESDLEGLLTFLQMIETGPKLVHVEDLRMEAQGGGAGVVVNPFYTPLGPQPEVITFRFTATAFTLAAPPAKASADSTSGEAGSGSADDSESTDGSGSADGSRSMEGSASIGSESADRSGSTEGAGAAGGEREGGAR